VRHEARRLPRRRPAQTGCQCRARPLSRGVQLYPHRTHDRVNRSTVTRRKAIITKQNGCTVVRASKQNGMNSTPGIPFWEYPPSCGRALAVARPGRALPAAHHSPCPANATPRLISPPPLVPLGSVAVCFQLATHRFPPHPEPVIEAMLAAGRHPFRLLARGARRAPIVPLPSRKLRVLLWL